MRKYQYYKVIQENWGYGWDDVDHHETDSTFWPLDQAAFKENLKAYRENSGAAGLRVINRREKITQGELVDGIDNVVS